MSVSLTKLTSSALVVVLLSSSAWAQTPSLALPPSDALTPPSAAQPTTPPADSGLALLPAAVPVATSAPVANAQSAPTPAAPTPAAATAPVAVTPAPQVTTPTPAPTPIATPVEAAPLKDIKADSVGLIANSEGGLGAGLWKGTSRAWVERFLPMLTLPVSYPSLNNLAHRFLLTTAGAPEGEASADKKNLLTILRAQKLVALGHAADAWKLANVAGTDQFEDADLRQITEMALVSPAAADVCTKLPSLIKTHTAIEWQKSMVVCQLRAGDTKAAQVSIDLLHSQDIHDDVFLALAEKNIMGSAKQLPHPLTPLKPLSLALLRLAELPVRGEIYAHPDAALIAELLKVKSADETARMALAERAAYRNIITAKELADVYASQGFTPSDIINAASSLEKGAKLRALLYQASQLEKDPKNRVLYAVKFLGSLDATSMGGSILSVMGTIMGDVAPDTPYNEESAEGTRVYMLADKGNDALAWLDLAHNASRGMPLVKTGLQNMWPLMVLAGMESEKDFADHLDVWLKAYVPEPDASDANTKAQKATSSALLMLMDAIGFTIPEDAWARVGDAATPEKTLSPPALILERLRSASTHKGEAIVLGTLASTGGKEDPPLFAILETIRALRAAGLAADAGYLAKDAAIRIMYPPVKS